MYIKHVFQMLFKNEFFAPIFFFNKMIIHYSTISLNIEARYPPGFFTYCHGNIPQGQKVNCALHNDLLLLGKLEAACSFQIHITTNLSLLISNYLLHPRLYTASSQESISLSEFHPC